MLVRRGIQKRDRQQSRNGRDYKQLQMLQADAQNEPSEHRQFMAEKGKLHGTRSTGNLTCVLEEDAPKAGIGILQYGGAIAARTMIKSSTTATRETAAALMPVAAHESTPGTLLEARGLRKTYGDGESAVTVLEAIVDLAVLPGEMIAIVAPSGAGKSTLLHLLAALDTPTSGTVYFEAKALETHRDEAIAEFRNRRIGFVWQKHHLLPDFTAAENVAMPLLMRDASYGEALRTAAQWLDEVGLASRTHHQAADLSGGEQQRVGIARALVNKPALLLADEPTGDLDEHNAFAIMNLLERLHNTHQLTSILATHNPVLARRCNRVLRLEHGVLQPDAAYQKAPSSFSEGEKS